MFEYIFWYEVNQWFLNDIAQKFWKILGFQKMINSHDVQLVNSLWERKSEAKGGQRLWRWLCLRKAWLSVVIWSSYGSWGWLKSSLNADGGYLMDYRHTKSLCRVPISVHHWISSGLFGIPKKRRQRCWLVGIRSQIRSGFGCSNLSKLETVIEARASVSIISLNICSC